MSTSYAACLKKVANITKVPDAFRWEDPALFQPDAVITMLPKVSPKLVALLRKIQELDSSDMSSSGKLYKHMIFSDMRPSIHGSKAAVAALLSVSRPEFIQKVHLHPLLTRSPVSAYNDTTTTTVGVLCSTELFQKPQPQQQRKEQLEIFNERPGNIHGEKMRFIVLDGGFKEGVDLFDVKYVHLLEPLSSKFGQRQAIGRATRHCGQKGLPFKSNEGWPLHVFKYDLLVDQTPISYIANRYMGTELNMASELCSSMEKICQLAAVDKELTSPLHNFEWGRENNMQLGGANKNNNKKLQSGSRFVPKERKGCFAMQSWVKDRFSKLKNDNNAVWKVDAIENMCKDKEAKEEKNSLEFTPTQNFMKLYFTPENPYKGMLVYHSVGTGKTATAISIASASFLKKGYTVLWVTRHTLKTDYYKNIFEPNRTAFLPFRAKMPILRDILKKGALTSGEKESILQKYKWIPPISYKQFTNLIRGKNKKLQKILVDRNGTEDPLHKTLIIIDEAHRLVDHSLPLQERPDVHALQLSLQNSYKVSKKDSVKVILMSATPFTNDPMDLCKLMNIIRDFDQEPIPTDMHEFAAMYLESPSKPEFSEVGSSRFADDISGQVSYLNRMYDIRQFARPIMHKVYVKPSQFSDPEYENILQQLQVTLQQKRKEANAALSVFQKQIEDLNNTARKKIKVFLESYEKTVGKDLLTEEGKKRALNYKKEVLAGIEDERSKIFAEHDKAASKYTTLLDEMQRKIDKHIQRRQRFLEKDDSVEGALYRCSMNHGPQAQAQAQTQAQTQTQTIPKA